MRFRYIRQVLCLLPLAVVALGAQQPGQRDTLQTPKTGTALIAGLVSLDERAPQPVRRARVTAASLDGTVTKWVMSDANGQFAIKDLPAGRYTLTATKPGQVRAVYGAKRFDRPGTPVSLTEGQQLSGLALKMLRGGVIAGTLRDENGQPAAGVSMQVMTYRTNGADRSLVAVTGGSGLPTEVTDDLGAYRIFGLPPGDYAVYASPRDAFRTDVLQTTEQDVRNGQQALGAASKPGQMIATSSVPAPANGNGAAPPPRVVDGPTVGLARLYYPGTTSPADATMITLAAGEEHDGVDMQLRLLHTAKVEGFVQVPPGVPADSVMLTLMPGNQSTPSVSTSFNVNGVSPRPDGKFTFTGVAPGAYTLTARASAPMPGGGPGPGGMGAGGSGRNAMAGPPNMNLWGMTDVNVDGQNQAGIAITLQTGMTVSGRLAFEGTRTEPAGDITRAQVLLLPWSAAGVGGMIRPVMLGANTNGEVDASGKFTVTGISPGKYRVLCNFKSPEATWTLKSAVFKGRDALDFPLEIGPNEDIGNGVLTFSDQAQTVTGKLSDGAGRPAPDFTIVVFPADKNLFVASRRIKTARPGTDGAFTVTDLPAGDYRIAALVDIAPGEANDPAFLQQLVPASVAFSLKDGESHRQDLRIAGATSSGSGGRK